MIHLDGRSHVGETLPAALTLAAATGQGFEMIRVRADDVRRGLLPEQTQLVRAAALACGARTAGLFDGSLDLRFEPAAALPGQYRFEPAGTAPAPEVLQTVLPILARGEAASQVEVTGGTHVAGSPCYELLAGPWSELLRRMGVQTEHELLRAGFHPGGGGALRASVAPAGHGEGLRLERRGALLRVRGVSAQARLRGPIAELQRDACQEWLWERRRLEPEWELRNVPSAGPGAYIFVEALYENGRGAACVLGGPGISPRRLGEQAARRALRLLEDDRGAVDVSLARQLAVPLALFGGGFLGTSCFTEDLEIVARVLRDFGVQVQEFGDRTTPGGLEVGAC